MRKEDILSKGTYVHSQIADLVNVKQYIIAKFRNKKALFLRFSNDRDEIATAITLRIRQYDVRGEYICSETIEARHLKISPLSEFTLKNPMIIKDSCVDFRVDILNVSYGNYTYDVIDGEAHVRYAKEEKAVKKSINTNQLRLGLEGKSQTVAVRSLKAPTLLVLVCSVLLLSLMCFSIGQLGYYMYTETCFTLDNFEYEFLTDNKDDGPIRLTRYNGYALNLVIPAEIEGYEISSIANTAFAGRNLRSITIEGNSTIEDGAFKNCKKLHTVSVKNVENIGSKAFSGCVALKTIELGESLKNVGDYAFSECSSLEAVELCEGLLSVGKYAFESCVKIEELVIPSTVESIGYGAVSGCNMSSLTVPFVGASADEYASLSHLYGTETNSEVRNALTSITVTNQVEIPEETFMDCITLRSVDFKLPIKSIGDSAFKGCKRITKFEIDDTVTYIGKNAFYECISIDGIIIPNGINKIEDGCFYGCSRLSSIVIPDSVNIIGKDAFKKCTSLKSLVVPKTVTQMQEGAFADCSSLIEVTIPYVGNSIYEPAKMSAVFGEIGADSIKTVNVTASTSICSGAFSDMDSLERVYLSASIKSIGTSAFENCALLQKITMSDDVKFIGDRAFFGCSSLNNFNIPSAIDYIGTSQFEGCESLSDIAIPENVTEIRDRAFAGCSSISEIIWPETLENIGEGAFEGCASLMSVSIPSGITEIKTSAFENCELLSIIALPASVTTIGERAFAGCDSLQAIELPGALECIEKEAFADCQMLRVFALPMSVNQLGAGVLSGCNSLEELTTHFMSNTPTKDRTSGNIGYFFDSENADNMSAPESLYSVTLVDIAIVGEGAFADCLGIDTVNLPKSLEKIEKGAFKNSGITKMIIPEGIDIIHESTFEDCTRLASVTLPKHLKTIDDLAFSGCESLETIKLQGNVESIGEYAFEGCSSLVEFTIPKSVQTIERSALSGCTSLETLVIPFVGCERGGNYGMGYVFGDVIPLNLRSITVTDSVDIPDNAFKGLAALKEINLPEDIRTIGSNAFSGCESLESFTVPGTVTYIGQNAFEGCSSLASITLPFAGMRKDDGSGIDDLFNGTPGEALKTVTLTQPHNISNGCFRECEYIERIVIEATVKYIGDNAFDACSSLKEIVLPETVVSIGESAFSGCEKLRSIVLPRDLLTIGEYAFWGCYELFEVYNHSTTVSVLPLSGTEGDVGYFALNVYINDEQPVKVKTDGFEFLKQNGGSAWYLINYEINEDGVCVTPNEFSYEGATIGSYSIPGYLFRMESDLVSLTLTESVVGIGRYAFFRCEQLVSADISSAKIGMIAPEAFCDCTSLVQIVIPEGVTEISEGAFRNCSSLENAILPQSLMYIGREAFLNCEKLSSVKIHQFVLDIGDSAFYGCINLDHVYNMSALPIEVGDSGYGYVAYYALLLDADEIPETLHKVEIGELVFKKSDDRWFLVGHNSTDGSLELSSFMYQDKYVDSYVIVREAFMDDTTITKVVFSDAVKSIGLDAFAGCTNLAEVDFLENYTLSLNDINWITGINGIKSITFQKTLTEIPLDFLSNFSSLESVSFIGNTNIEEILPYSFESSKDTLKTVILPDSLKTIHNNAFEGCSALESIDIPDTVTVIGNYAFNSCSSLASVGMPDSLESIGDYAFYCSGINSLTVGSNVEYIGQNAFAFCYSLKNVDLSSSYGITAINDYSFYGCQTLDEIMLPDSVERIGNAAFYECNSLTAIDIPYALQVLEDQAFYNCYGLKSVRFNENITYIGFSAFAYCTALEDVVIPQYVTSLSEYAFAYSGLKTVTMDGCATIGNYAFTECPQLTSVIFSDNLITIGECAFIRCYSLQTLNLSGYAYLESIGSNAFSNCTSLTAVDLSGSSSLNYIGGYAFAECSSLESADLADCALLGTIEHCTFQNDTALKTVDLSGCSSLNKIDGSAFANCSALENVDLSVCANLQYLEYDAFAYCIALKSIEFPTSLSSIGSYAFSGCTALESVDLIDCTNLTYIDSYAFNSCTSLSSVNFPSSLNSIGYYSFAYCTALRPIRIPRSVTYIDSYAFYGCEGLYEIWNESSLSLTPGSTQNGYIAYYAIVVHDEFSDASITFSTEIADGLTYEFAYDHNTDTKYLIGVQGYESGMVFMFPKVSGDGYIVTRFVAQDVYFDSAYVTLDVIGFESNYISTWYYPIIYFEGTSVDYWYRISGTTSYSAYSLYTYIECKHDYNNTWMYGYDGEMTTSVSTWTEVVVVESTCTEKGNANRVCDKCGTILENYELPLLEHNLVETVEKSPTCTEDGKVNYVCNDCQGIIDYYITSKLGHETEELVVKEATCTEKGLVNIVCTRCKEIVSYYELPMIEHDEKHVTVKEATCTSNGFVNVVCNNCEQIIDSYETGMLDHETQDIVSKAATCTEMGVINEHCILCQSIVASRYTPMLPHDYDENNICTVCTRQVTTPERWLEEGLSFDSSQYTFEKNKNGYYVSNNNGMHNSSAEMKFVAAEDMTMTFSFQVSSEQNYDVFIVNHNGREIVNRSGETDMLEYTVTLQAGDKVVFKYEKDGSGKSGSDCVFIYSIVLTPVA